MTPGTIVVALGGNAVAPPGERPTIANQFRHTRESLSPVVELARAGWRLALVHGNGPQVGNLLVKNELARDVLRAEDDVRTVLLVAACRESHLLDYGNERARFMFNFGDGAVAALFEGDAGSNLVGLVGVQAARRPPDEDHPYGHRKYETLAAAAILVLLLLVTAITLNLLKIFELPVLAGEARPAGSFGTGALAAFVATPCAGPFLGSALGTALLLPMAGSAIVFAALGILDDFFRTTFLEIPQLAGAYTLSFFGTPPSIAQQPALPELLAAWLRLDSLPHLTWCAIAIATAVLLTKKRTRIREPFILVGLWIVLGAISYGERHHLYFRVAIAAMLIPAAWYAIRRRFVLGCRLRLGRDRPDELTDPVGAAEHGGHDQGQPAEPQPRARAGHGQLASSYPASSTEARMVSTSIGASLVTVT